MKKQVSWLAKILFSATTNIKSGKDLDKGYQSFSRGLFLILMVLVLVPATTISILAHSQYHQLLQEEEMDQLVLHIEQATGTIEKFVSELQSIVKFVARDDLYVELLDPVELEALFVRLQSEYPGFADIEVVDIDGLQKSYFGPYQLAGRNYSNQNWYKEVLRQGVYISTVFSGFRQVPHFVIAVSRKHPQKKGNWVLRVTIDAQKLQNIVDTISTSYADDMFLVDENCFPQTQPQKYGTIGEKCLLPTLEDVADKSFKKRISRRQAESERIADMLIVQKSHKGQRFIQSVVDLNDTPWRLVLVKEQYLHADAWGKFKIRLITIFLSCVIVAVFVIAELCDGITNHIRESDKKRQQFLAEAEQSNKLASIGRLAAGVAHEINNPLSIINQKTGLIEDYMEMSEDFEHKIVMLESLGSIQSSVTRCKTITHRLLGFARHTDTQTDEIEINSLLNEVVDFLAKEATYNQIQIDFDLDQDVKNIFSDRGQLQQIFLNITNNAIDAIGSLGQITLMSRQIDKETIQVRIIDNGPGMPPEVKERIFDPFFTTKETGKGTGLGLSITYGIVKKLGGNIKVTSERDKGTTFEITLPVIQN